MPKKPGETKARKTLCCLDLTKEDNHEELASQAKMKPFSPAWQKILDCALRQRQLRTNLGREQASTGRHPRCR